jgi:hypothetical protein
MVFSRRMRLPLETSRALAYGDTVAAQVHMRHEATARLRALHNTLVRASRLLKGDR